MTVLEKAQLTQEKLCEQIENSEEISRQRPYFHFATPGGHAVTTDFVTWKTEPVAIAPDCEADNKGCFSGTAIEDEGKPIFFIA